MFDEGPFDDTHYDQARRLQDGLIATATGGGFAGGDPEYRELREIFALRADTKPKLPSFVCSCRDVGQFWGWIKHHKSTYQELRTLIWEAFRPLLDHLEAHDRAPAIAPITEVLEKFDPENVQAAWQKPL
jgi:hypothetical protein